jgi:hypothetical protein
MVTNAFTRKEIVEFKNFARGVFDIIQHFFSVLVNIFDLLFFIVRETIQILFLFFSKKNAT